MSARFFGIVAVIAVVFTGSAMAAASAFGILPFDPSSVVQTDYAGWARTAQGYARNIYLFLFLFELIALAITTLLFRENLGEFFASVGFKILLGGVFFWFIANGPNLAFQVISWFEHIGATSFGGNASPLALVTGCLTAATAFFAAVGIAHADDINGALLLNTPPFCVWIGLGDGACPVGAITAANASHAAFELFAQGLGLMIIMAALGIFLQFIIVTIESYLVMSVGIIMLGLAGSRWTFPFSQGYFSYMINVGVKLMVTYIILGVAGTQLVPIVTGAAITLLGASLIPFGYSDAIATGAAAVTAVYVVLTAGLLWTIPAFSAALLSGQSQSSGSAILQQAMGSFAGAAQSFAQFGAAGRQQHAANDARGAQHNVGTFAPGAGGAANASGLTSQQMATDSNVDRFAPAPPASAPLSNGSSAASPATVTTPGAGALGNIGIGAKSANAPSLYNNAFTNARPTQALSGGGGGGGTGGYGLGSGPSGPMAPIDGNTGMSYGDQMARDGSGDSSNRDLNDRSAEQIQHMNRSEFVSRLRNTDLTALDADQKGAIADYHRDEATSFFGQKAEEAQGSADLYRAYGLGGLAQTAPRDIGQPTAVQVRTSNPDRA